MNDPVMTITNSKQRDIAMRMYCNNSTFDNRGCVMFLGHPVYCIMDPQNLHNLNIFVSQCDVVQKDIQIRPMKHKIITKVPSMNT